ncbi:hypothetical protein Bca101_007722 [Brassica carinata]
MGNETDKKFTWVIKNFSSWRSKCVRSRTFVVGRCKWSLGAFPRGVDNAKIQYWFDQKDSMQGFQSMIRLSDLNARDSGFLVNGELKIVAEVDVLEVVGELDVPVVATDVVDINGFQVLASQVESVNILFEKYPNIASNVRVKNSHLRTTYLNILLSLTEILSKSPEEISNSDMVEAYSALSFVINAGFKLDWLEKALKEACEIRIKEIEEKLSVLTEKRADMDALLNSLK